MTRPHQLRSAIEDALVRVEVPAWHPAPGIASIIDDWRAWHSAQLVLIAAALDQLASSRRMLELGVANARHAPAASPAKIRACEELLEELDTFDKAARKRVDAQLERAKGQHGG